MPAIAGIYYSLHDSGQKEQPPVILLHGAGSSHQIWAASIRRLESQRVFAIDLPGHGKSTSLGQQSISAYSDQIVEFLAALGLYHAVFVGHGMGGAIALEMAIRHPSHTAGLGLISTGAHLGVDPEMAGAFSNPLTLSGALHSFQQKAFGPSTPPNLQEKCLEEMKRTRSSVLAADWFASTQFDQRGSILQVNVPAWIIVGSDDQLTPVAYAHFLAGRIPAARLEVIPNASHMVILEQPERVANCLQQFLSALFATRRSNTLPASLPASRTASTAHTLPNTAGIDKDQLTR
jgi:pimeloyl-ACP methyl ester carboxylesterase